MVNAAFESVGMPVFQFSETQLSSIRNLKAQRLFPEAYRNIAAWAAGQDGIDDRSILWFSAAADINAGTGAFSHLIRSYTSIQYQYRYGVPLTSAQIQDASNAIADAVLADVLALRTVPAIERLGALDAAGAAARIFNGDEALWSGNLLFLMFRDSGPFMANIIEDEPDNPYDFLAMMKAFAHAQGEARIASSAGELFDALLTIWETVTGGGVAAIVQRGITAQSVAVTATIASALASGNALLNDAYDDRVSLASLVTADSIRLGRVDIGDSLIGGSGYDLMLGEAGNDGLQGLGDDDVLDGGEGADMLFGGDGEDDMFGRAGSDQLNGGTGDDYLNGGDGGDFLTGGAGADRFILKREGGLDTIMDPEAADRIVYDGSEISGTAQNLDNGLYKLGNFVFTRAQGGLDLMVVPAGGSGPAALIKNFFPAGYDGQSDLTLMGITLPKDSRKPGDLGIPGDTAKTSPIALDLNGDGLRYIPYVSTLNPPHFDIDNDGFAEGMEWLDKNDGFLVRDTNGNGRIDNQREMFGDDGGTTAYQKLAQLDTNHDNRVSAADAGFSGLRIWQDLNSNGKTDAGELKTLESLQIVSLSLQLTNATSLNGHAVAGTSEFTRANGSVGVAADVLFDVRQSDSIYVGSDTSVSPPVDASTLFLPLSRGYGTLPALHYAMTQNSSLKAMVTELAGLELSRLDEVYDRVYTILLAWGDASGIAPTGSANDRHAAKLAVLQRFVDGDTSEINVDQAFGSLFSNMVSKLLIQGPLKSVLPGMAYNFATDTIVFDSAFLQGLDGILAQARLTAPTDSADRSIYWTEIVRILSPLSNAYARVAEAAGFNPAFPARIIGSSGNDILTGYLGSTFQGLGGDDVFHAGPSTFMYNIGDGADTIYQNPLSTPDQHASIYFGQGITFDALTFQVTGDKLVLGIPGNGSITFANFKFLDNLRFTDGSFVEAYQFNFAMFGGNGTSAEDLLYGNAAANIIAGLGGDDHLSGLAGDDRLEGGAGDDWLQGNEGADILDGGDGIDTVAYGATVSNGGMTSTTTGVIIDLKLATQRGGDAEGDTLRNIENVVGTDFDDFFAGDANANFFEGWAGIDTVSYASSPGAVIVDLGKGYTPQSGGDAEGDMINNMDKLIGSRFDDVLTAGYTDSLDGAGGNDTLIGGPGREMLTGGEGRDAFVVRKGSAFTTTIVDLNILAGETVRLEGFGDAGKFINLVISQSGANAIIALPSGQSITLLNVNKAQLTAAVFGEAPTVPGQATNGNDILAGTGGDDILFGLGGDDNLDGGPGADRLVGGLGNDGLTGSSGSDTYVFDAGDGVDRIEDNGFRDNDRLIIHGYVPTDVTLHRAGNDLTLRFIGSTDVITIISTIDGDLSDHVEEIAFDDGTIWNDLYVRYLLSGTPGAGLFLGSGAGEQLFGTAGNDSIYAQDGNDTVWGGTGDDQMFGGAGADLLGGDAGADKIGGGSGNDTIYGGADNDDLRGGGDADFILGDSGNDLVSGDGGADRLFGYDGEDQLRGGGGEDRLHGEAGADRIDGGLGADFLEGGTGADVFVFGAAGDSRTLTMRSDGGKLRPDMIGDFTSGQDRIDLSAIDAKRATDADDAFAFIGTAAFGGQAGQLRYQVAGGVIRIEGDVDGDALADFAIMATAPLIVAADFIL